MKKFIIAFTLSASLALGLLQPNVQAASTPGPAHATNHPSGHAKPSTASIDELNARMRKEIQQTGKLPDPATLPLPHLPEIELHAVYLVDTNKKGQVVKVRAGHPSQSDSYNTYTYFNALQTFIRRVDGSATPGVFRLTYDYSPATRLIKRDVALIQKGGVNANAIGAVDVMKHQLATSHAPPAASKK